MKLAFTCPLDFDALGGAGTVRHCGTCDRNVYDVTDCTTAELDALRAREGSFCAQWLKRPDGSITTRPLMIAALAACGPGGGDETWVQDTAVETAFDTGPDTAWDTLEGAASARGGRIARSPGPGGEVERSQPDGQGRRGGAEGHRDAMRTVTEAPPPAERLRYRELLKAVDEAAAMRNTERVMGMYVMERTLPRPAVRTDASEQED